MPKGGIDVFGCTRQVRDRLLELNELNTNLIALLLWLGLPARVRALRAAAAARRTKRVDDRHASSAYAIDSVFSFTDLPIRALLFLGAAGTRRGRRRVGATVFVCWLLGRMPVLGYTPLMLVITFFGGLTALGLGIVGQYLWLSLQNTRGRPSFVVKSSTRGFGPSAES